MPSKHKRFDCVEMKRSAQEHLRKEYNARKSQFASYAEFLQVKADESKLAKAVRSKIATCAKDAASHP